MSVRSVQVGYRNPPLQNRFRKGVSGNPRGRPRKGDTRASPTPNLREIFERVASEPVPVTIDGRRQMMTGPEAFLLNLQARACQGDPRAAKLYADLLVRFGFGEEKAGLTHEEFLDRLEAGLVPESEPEDPTPT